jgi:hypothetical protein
VPRAVLAAVPVRALLLAALAAVLVRCLVQNQELPIEVQQRLAVVAPSWLQLGLDPEMQVVALVLAGLEELRHSLPGDR